MKYLIIILAAIPFLFSFKDLDTIKKEDINDLVNPDTFPVPTVPKLLFYIQRDPNTNTIVYELNADKDGKPSVDEPVNAYWIRYPEGGVKKSLNYLQRKFAYGIDSKPLGNGNYELRSVAYSKLPLYLKRDVKNQYHVYTDINNKKCVLNRVFIRIDGGTFWSPNVLYIELKGIEIATGKTIKQRIIPS